MLDREIVPTIDDQSKNNVRGTREMQPCVNATVQRLSRVKTSRTSSSYSLVAKSEVGGPQYNTAYIEGCFYCIGSKKSTLLTTPQL